MNNISDPVSQSSSGHNERNTLKYIYSVVVRSHWCFSMQGPAVLFVLTLLLPSAFIVGYSLIDVGLETLLGRWLSVMTWTRKTFHVVMLKGVVVLVDFLFLLPLLCYTVACTVKYVIHVAERSALPWTLDVASLFWSAGDLAEQPGSSQLWALGAVSWVVVFRSFHNLLLWDFLLQKLQAEAPECTVI